QGRLSIFNNAGQSHVVVDVTGWFDPAAGYTPLEPARLADTRRGVKTVDGRSQGVGKIAGGETLDVGGTGRAGVPTSDPAAVVVNVTAVQPSKPTHLTVYATGTVRPNASNLNLGAGETVPNLAVVRVGVGGRITIFNNDGSTDVVVDIAGWF